MCDKLKLTQLYREEVIRLIRDLTTVHYYLNSDNRTFSVLEPLSQRDISNYLGVTFATVSRASSGVCSLSGEAFYALVSLHSRRLRGTLNFSPINTALEF